MDEQAGQGRASRRAGLRPLPTPTDIELVVADGPPLIDVVDELPEPRIAELDALLREVDNLRATMRRDLTLAATAVEAGADDLAGWLLLGEDGQVRAFEERALTHLSALQAADEADELAATVTIPAPRRASRMLPAAPLVTAAAAVVAFLTGVIPGTGSPVTSPKTSNAAQSYAQLTALAANGASASSISAAAQKFHSDLAPLVATANTDPAAAQRAIDLLQSERAVIAGEADSPALRAVLAQADLLVRKLRARLPRTTVVVPAGPPSGSSRSSSAPKSSASPKASPSPSPSPKASPKPSPSASPSASSKPSSSSTPSSGPIPGAPVPH